jgi:hypothetical protein
MEGPTKLIKLVIIIISNNVVVRKPCKEQMKLTARNKTKQNMYESKDKKREMWEQNVCRNRKGRE